MGSTGLPQRSITKKKTEDGRYRQISWYKETETGRWENTHRNASQVYQVSKMHNSATVKFLYNYDWSPKNRPCYK